MTEYLADNMLVQMEKYEQELIQQSNIESSPDKMETIDNTLFQFWQTGFFDKLYSAEYANNR